MSDQTTPQQNLVVACHPLLYQYMPPIGVDAIRHKRILTSSPETMNDPFEWRPAVNEHVTEADFINAFSAVSSVFPFHEMAISEARRYQDQFPNESARHYRVICLSAEQRVPLLWSHYADKHRGFAVVVNTSELIKAGNALAVDVIYDSRRSLIPHPWKDNRIKENLLNTFHYKSKEWKYEKETRLLVPLEHLEAAETSLGLFLPVPGAVFHEVIFGHLCSDRDKMLLRQACKRDPELQHVVFRQACLSRDYYSITIDPY